MLSIAEAFPAAVAAVMRHDDPEAAYEACLHAVRGGIQTLEVTTSVPDHLGVVRHLLESSGVPVGIGTVTRPDQARPRPRSAPRSW